MRRASIDRINNRYKGTTNVSPTGFAARTSAIRTVSPVAPFYSSSYTPPSGIISTGAVLPGTTAIGGRATIGRGTLGGSTIGGGQIIRSNLGPAIAQNTIIRNSRIGVSGIRGSVVTTPPVY
jgi:tetrahydrodipicolinate N-succinyltransferase